MADFLRIGKLVENLTALVKVKIELLKLEIVEEISKGIATLFALFTVLILLFFVLIFGSLTVAVVINQIYDSTYLGYLIVTIFYVILLAIIFRWNQSGKLAEKIEEELVKRSKEIAENKTDNGEDGRH